MLALWLIVLLLVLFGVIGGIAIGKVLFLILIAAAILALFGLFSRSTA